MTSFSNCGVGIDAISKVRLDFGANGQPASSSEQTRTARASLCVFGLCHAAGAVRYPELDKPCHARNREQGRGSKEPAAETTSG